MTPLLRRREQTLLIAAVAVVAVVVVFLVLFLPKIQDVRTARREVARKQDERVRLVSLVQARAQIEAEHSAASRALQGLRARVPTAPDLPGFIAAVDQAIGASGVHLLRIAYGKAETAAAPGGSQSGGPATIGTLPLVLQVRGSYPQLRALVSTVESLPRTVSIDRVVMTAAGGGIVADITMRAFFFK